MSVPRVHSLSEFLMSIAVALFALGFSSSAAVLTALS